MKLVKLNDIFLLMDNGIKNILRAAIIIVALSFAYSAVSYVVSYSRSIEPSAFRSFSVSGEGKIVAIPDVGSFNFSVIVEGGKDIAALQRENAEKANKIIAFIKSQGVETKDIKTLDYGLEPRYQYFSCSVPLDDSRKPCPPPEIVGYTIRQTVQVKVRNFSKIGGILAGVVENGANSVSQLSFEIDDIEIIRNQAREQAIKQAKEKAESVARAGGFRLGKLLSIEEEGITPIYYRSLEAKSISELPSPTIEPGSQEVAVSVNLRYEIK